jgi:hypothetical protein
MANFPGLLLVVVTRFLHANWFPLRSKTLWIENHAAAKAGVNEFTSSALFRVSAVESAAGGNMVGEHGGIVADA